MIRGIGFRMGHLQKQHMMETHRFEDPRDHSNEFSMALPGLRSPGFFDPRTPGVWVAGWPFLADWCQQSRGDWHLGELSS